MNVDALLGQPIRSQIVSQSQQPMPLNSENLSRQVPTLQDHHVDNQALPMLTIAQQGRRGEAESSRTPFRT